MRSMKMRGWLAGALGVIGAAGSAWAGTAPNDECANALAVECGRNTGNNLGATGAFGATGCVGADDVWYTFVAPATGGYDIAVRGTATGGGTILDPTVQVFDACGGTSLACDDDSGEGFDALITGVALQAGQTYRVRVARFLGENGTYTIDIRCPGERECCEPWDNGDFDRRNAQTSQIGVGEDWREFGRITADDFWLCEGQIYRINSISGKLCTDSVVPKAQVYVYENCDGFPGRLVAFADSVPDTSEDGRLGWECRTGTISIEETGGLTDNGFRIIDVRANFPGLWLKGGQYFVSIVGYSGTADPDEQFFWGTSGNGVVRGRPGVFYDFEEGGWADVEECCIGCTDFNFCVLGEVCKILLDNGSLDPLWSGRDDAMVSVPDIAGGSPSLQNGGRTADKVRTADDFVVPPCEPVTLCYIEAWILTNCERVRLEIYRNDCKLPEEAAPIYTLETSCLTEYGHFTVGGQLQTLYKAEFYDLNGRAGVTLEPGNYWLSVFALGDGRQNARGSFVHNYYCDRTCTINFNPGAIKGPPYDSSQWRSVTPARDFAFLVAIEPEAREPDDEDEGDEGTGPACPADVNRDGEATIQDLFDFLQAFFAGCP